MNFAFYDIYISLLTLTTVVITSLLTLHNSPLWPLPPPAWCKKETFLIWWMFPSWKERKERYENNFPNSVSRCSLTEVPEYNSQSELDTFMVTVTSVTKERKILLLLMNRQNSWSLLLLFWVSLGTWLVLLLELNGLGEYSRGRAQSCFNHE